MSLSIGYDVGSSSIKASLLDTDSGKPLASAVSPDTELEIIAQRPGWAEQNPQTWMEHLQKATERLKSKANFKPADVKAVGISYQMHGLVLVDKAGKVLRPAIIWCDGRAVETGIQAAKDIGKEKCLRHLLNLPGNFTATRLKWVKDNQPEIYRRIDKMLLPGDYVAMMLTGWAVTTASGLSEAILWDFKNNRRADFVLESLGIDKNLIPQAVPTFSIQGELTKQAADMLHLAPGTPVAYRGGDQPNNALSLNVLRPGEIAATAGTSGVVYGVTDKANYDPLNRVNTFVHVNHRPDTHRYGILLCLSGAGICNSWLKHNIAGGQLDYQQMDAEAMDVEPGSAGLMLFPYGNGAERSLKNRNIAAAVEGWNFNIHDRRHFFRAAQEGIVFGLNFGLQIMRDMGTEIKTIRAGKANMFLSPLFGKIFAALTDSVVELYNTDGSVGAARGAAFGAGLYKNIDDAFVGLEPLRTIEPDQKLKTTYRQIYDKWLGILKSKLADT